MSTLTKVIKSGNSQAVRIPARMRLKSKEVQIHETPAGILIIDPLKRDAALKALMNLQDKGK